jgi:ABC-type sugar transport system ATPase subunit
VEFEPRTEDRARLLASKNFTRTTNRNMDKAIYCVHQQHMLAERKSQMGNLSLENNVTMYAKEMGRRTWTEFIWIRRETCARLEERPVPD